MEPMKYNTSLIIIYQNSQQKIGVAKLETAPIPIPARVTRVYFHDSDKNIKKTNERNLR